MFNLLKIDPEWLHHQTLSSFGWLSQNQVSPFSSWLNQSLQSYLCLKDDSFEQHLLGLNFPNPVGLAAGFDKDGVAINTWANLGFGFAELGTVTYHPQEGNPLPRLFRLELDKAVLNRMGFNNSGAYALATKLSHIRQESTLPIPIGINLGKSRITPLVASAQDYLESFRVLKNLGDYFVINVSSPNTPGLRSLQDAAMLSTIFDVLQQENNLHKPLLVKIAPDLAWEAIAQIVDLAKTYGIAGIIATNTTVNRDGLKTTIIGATGNSPEAEVGGISGQPLRHRSTEIIRYIWRQTKGEILIIGVGGIFSAEDAWEKITSGASLIQVYTGWVYEGPLMVRRILAGLSAKLRENGLTNLRDAVGLAVKTEN